MTADVWAQIKAWLPGVERIVLLVAALAALVPLWQWWIERGERRLDRIATLIQTADLCAGIELDPIKPLPERQGDEEPPALKLGWPLGTLALCGELEATLWRDPHLAPFIQDFREMGDALDAFRDAPAEGGADRP
jgi:hypothetical protein